MYKTLIFVANLLIICSATEDLKADESVNTPLLKPSGRPLHIHAEVPALEESRSQVEYITSDNQDELRPAVDYISTPNVEQRPTVEYISKRPVTSYGYITHHQSPSSIYGSHAYGGVPRISYAAPQRGYQTGYQYIRPEKQQPIVRSYPLQQTYYPLQSLYQYQYGYQYPQYISQYPQYLSQYLQPQQQQRYTYLPIVPLKKK